MKSAGMSLEGKREADSRLARSWDAISGGVVGLGDIESLSG